MKKTFTLLLSMALISLAGFSQSNLIFISTDGYKFTVQLNGVNQNPVPAKNVQVRGIDRDNCYLCIRFENPRFPSVSKYLNLARGVESTYIVTTLQHPGPTAKHLCDHPANTGNYDIDQVIVDFVPDTHSPPPGEPGPQPVIHPYTGALGCPVPMSPAAFNMALESIRDKSFESSKVEMAEQIAKSNCLLSEQVYIIMKLFNFENTRIDFAKFAYGYIYDPGNYFRVNDAFAFESSIETLNKFIRSKEGRH